MPFKRCWIKREGSEKRDTYRYIGLLEKRCFLTTRQADAGNIVFPHFGYTYSPQELVSFTEYGAMNKALFPLLLAALLLAQKGMVAQDVINITDLEAPEDVKPDGDAAEEKPDVASADEIDKLIKTGKLDDAAQNLEAAISADPENAKLMDLRDKLARSYLVRRKYRESFEQLEKSFEHRLARADNGTQQSRLTATTSLLRIAAMRVGRPKIAQSASERAVAAIDANDQGIPSMISLSMLVPGQAGMLARRGDVEGARELLKTRIERIDSLDAAGAVAESLAIAKARFMFGLASLPEASEKERNSVDQFISSAVEKYPESRQILSEFTTIQSLLISRTYRDDPEAAKQRIDRVKAVLTSASERDKGLGYLLSRIKSLQPRVEAALRLKEMIGQPAPKFEVAAWVHQGDEEINEDSLQGKVVLLDFWSVWCGPCIATFPHLRDWYDEFHDRGFEIVGVTRYYGYTWDDEAGRPIRSKEKVESEAEHEMLKKFFEHHELRHSTIVTPKESQMQKDYGVTGIPHAVLIDRQGNVQMVKVGAGPSNAEALHEKIKALVGQ